MKTLATRLANCAKLGEEPDSNRRPAAQAGGRNVLVAKHVNIHTYGGILQITKTT